MVLHFYTIFIYVLEVIFYTFHLSMFLLLLFKRKTSFKGPFYSIFRVVLIADLACCASYMLSIRVPQSGIATDFYKNNGFFASIFYHISSYFICVQFIGHLFMALNRFTLLWFPFKYHSFWKNQWYISLLIILPFLPICYRLHQPGEFKFTANGTVVVTLTDANLMSITFIISAVIYVSTTFIEAILNFLSLIKLPSNANNNPNNRNEKDLLFVSVFYFIAQLFRTCYTIGRPMFAENVQMTVLLVDALPLMNIVFAGAGSVSLMLLSRTTRKEYKNFYFFGGNVSQIFVISPNQGTTNS